MGKIYGFLYRRRLVWLFLLLMTLAIALLSSWRKGAPNSAVLPRVALELFGPFQRGFEKGTGFLRNMWKRYVYLVGLEEENRMLREIVQDMRREKVESVEARLENVRLRSLVGFKKNMPKPLLPAQVVGRDVTGLFRTLVIDRGKQDGIVEGMAVLAVQGVVGQVMECSSHFSRVLLITDPNSDVAAMVQRSRARGIVEGRGLNPCCLKYVHRSEDIEEGDLVLSSGLDGIFPKGALIGTVSRVDKRETELFQDVDVEPSVDFNKLEELLVVCERPLPPQVSRENPNR